MRIILADHHAQARWALETMLEEQPDYDLIGQAANAECLLLLAQNRAADLFLVDRELPGAFIEDLIASLHALKPRPIVIVMSSGFEYSRMLLMAGADAFVSKGDPPNWLLQTLRRFAKRVNTEGRSE